MSADFEYKLGKYAEVIVKSGLNLQPGQRLVIGSPIYELMGVPIELAPLVL
jgi:leucyl aminopeptidase (aminopeptidase T)